MHLVAGAIGFGTDFWVVGVAFLVFWALIGSFLFNLWSDTKKRKRMADAIESNLRMLDDEGFSECELKTVASFVNRNPEMGLIFLEDRKQLGKEEFLAFIDEFNRCFPVETWQRKVCFLALFVSILGTIFGTFLIFH